ncbi:hypothetical protein EUTSA_v10026259mg [Eutrema salsugineum]|uniref:DUF7890 domain-containing protein n=1 Tax=Eutrema salsugineum TaxID=72664 RepID=V4MI08_EUTSA|nr:uncharacterized protein LOC18030814 [Eutrema salsugineum]ESQ54957.1 hypothetical protein EUTSA_v10026259mg [Eutrema salsugineum]
MMDSLAKCFNGLQERYENILEAKPIYRDDLDITLPLNGPEVPTKKPRCLQRAKRIDKSLRFEEEGEEEGEEEEIMAKPLAKKEGVKPRKVVRFQLENNKIFEPERPVRFDLDQELEPEEKPLEEKPLEEKEGLSIVKGKEEVVRVKIKMTKQEAQMLLAKCKNDSVLDFEHVVDQIAHVPVHQLQVAVVVVASNNERQGNGCWDNL